jgi:hypothetical protein
VGYPDIGSFSVQEWMYLNDTRMTLIRSSLIRRFQIRGISCDLAIPSVEERRSIIGPFGNKETCTADLRIELEFAKLLATIVGS